jgi:hypothetical protein
MNIPEWVKPGLYGVAAGAIALAIVGFTWGGWMTAGTADKMASDHARMEVIAALVPICLEHSKQDPQAATTMAELEKAGSNYERTNVLMSTGWATMPGSSDPNRSVASACVEKLAAQF